MVLPRATLLFVQRTLAPLIPLWARRRHPFRIVPARLFVRPAMIPTIRSILQTFLVLRNPSEEASVLQSSGRRTSQSRTRTPTYLHPLQRTTGTCAFIHTVYFFRRLFHSHSSDRMQSGLSP